MKNNMCLNCRDCLHFKACYEMAAANEAEEFNTLFANTCEDFTDRSEWVHLPCKVGDTVYSFCDCFGVILPYFVETFNVSYYDKNTTTVWQYEANCTNNEEDELLDSIDFEVEDIGKTVFLTREEAERALEEVKK